MNTNEQIYNLNESVKNISFNSFKPRTQIESVLIEYSLCTSLQFYHRKRQKM